MVGRSLPGKCVYAYVPHLSGEDFYNKHSFFSRNGWGLAEFINGDQLSSFEIYYGEVEGYDSPSWGNLLVCRKITEPELQDPPDRLSLGYIFTTGPPQEDADGYYSSYKVSRFHLMRKWGFSSKSLYTMCL